MSEYLFTEDHQWIRDEGDGHAIVGITDFAQRQLGDIVYVELPEPGTAVTQHEPAGSVESVKAMADLHSPASGSVERVNERLAEEPELLNTDPMDDGWLFRIRLSEPDELEELITEEEYRNFVATQE